MERDEVVAGHDRTGVIEHALVISEAKRAKPKLLGEPGSGRDGLIGLARHGAPGPIELFRATPQGQRLERVDAESMHVWRQVGEGRGAAHMRDPRAHWHLCRHRRNDVVGDAEHLSLPEIRSAWE